MRDPHRHDPPRTPRIFRTQPFSIRRRRRRTNPARRQAGIGRVRRRHIRQLPSPRGRLSADAVPPADVEARLRAALQQNQQRPAAVGGGRAPSEGGPVPGVRAGRGTGRVQDVQERDTVR